MIALNINVNKIDKTALYEGKNGKYLALTLIKNKQGVDDYGNHGFVSQDLGKERRLKGERGPILGNYKEVGGFTGQKPQTTTSAAPTNLDEADDIPF